MTDAENSDEERYANESFENESDTDVPEMSEFKSVSTENSDDEADDEDLPSVKINTGPIKINSYSKHFNKTDAVPFASSSDEEDDVIVGETLAEINTPSMMFEDELPIPGARHLKPILNENNSYLRNVDEDMRESSEEISEEEDDEDEDEEDEDLKRIKDMEEKYLQQISAKTPKQTNIENSEDQEENIQEIKERETESESEREEEDEYEDKEKEESELDNENPLASIEENHQDFLADTNIEDTCSDNSSRASRSPKTPNKYEDNTIESIDQTTLMQLIQSSLTSLKVTTSNDEDDDNLLKMCQASPVLNEMNKQIFNTSNKINSEQIALAIVNVLKSAGLTNLETKDNSKAVEQDQAVVTEIKESEVDAKEKLKYNAFVEEKKDEIEEIQHNDNYDNDRNIYYDAHFDYRITSKTPTSFNSDDYVIHANFIKSFHRTNSTEKLRVKPYPRKSMSFSNERMREIERHNQILLHKILTQKPTYSLKSKSSQSSLQKLPSETNARLTTSAVNRKKQRRQIDLDNQVLKRKLVAISLRKRPIMS